MSKHVWRGMSEGGTELKFVTTNVPYSEWKNCTVVEDAACFPVREAMRMCQLLDRYGDRGFVPGFQESLKNYRKAVARMKARKGKRK